MATRQPSSDSRLTVKMLIDELMRHRDEVQAAQQMRFFKTGPGEYGEGDRFLGLKAPITRAVLKPYRGVLDFGDYARLLASEWHELRTAALLLLGEDAARAAKKGDAAAVTAIASFYDANLERANNWDLVDISVNEIMGPYWNTCNPGKQVIRKRLKTWADSGNLWRERAAMVATHARQRAGSLDETFWLAEYFLGHPHDLMHKASGWMLREAGKRDIEALRRFLAAFHTKLPRTALRYAIERMDKDERARWMRG